MRKWQAKQEKETKDSRIPTEKKWSFISLKVVLQVLNVLSSKEYKKEKELSREGQRP